MLLKFIGILSLSIHAAWALNAKDIPIAHTPIHFDLLKKKFLCGYGDTMPEPVLLNCTEPLVKEAVDLRGLWRENKSGRLERIEQCGRRVVISSHGVIHDMYVTGKGTIGVYDVRVQDLPECHVIAVYAEFSDHQHLKLYLPLAQILPDKLVVTRTLINRDVLEINYNGRIMRYSRVDQKSTR